MNKTKPIVSVIMGSDSDLLFMKEAALILDEFEIPYEMSVYSAHRAPNATRGFALSAIKRGIKVIIAGAGGSAHLAGVVASLYPLPVIGVPIKSLSLDGVDSLYSTVQMPPGVPVATVGINAAKNAGLLAIQILAVDNPSLIKKIVLYKIDQENIVIEKSKRLQQQMK